MIKYRIWIESRNYGNIVYAKDKVRAIEEYSEWFCANVKPLEGLCIVNIVDIAVSNEVEMFTLEFE